MLLVFGTGIYAIHCVCGTIVDTLCEIIEVFYSGLLVEYSNDIENKKEADIKINKFYKFVKLLKEGLYYSFLPLTQVNYLRMILYLISLNSV